MLRIGYCFKTKMPASARRALEGIRHLLGSDYEKKYNMDLTNVNTAGGLNILGFRAIL